jgi:hypothetical protein
MTARSRRHLDVRGRALPGTGNSFLAAPELRNRPALQSRNTVYGARVR